MKKVIKWAPRILSIIFIAFISLFALDMFSTEYKWWEMIIGFLMHMIPNLILIFFLVVAWKKPLFGGLTYLLISLAFFIMFDGYEQITTFLFICLPVLIIGILFILDYELQKREVKL